LDKEKHINRISVHRFVHQKKIKHNHFIKISSKLKNINLAAHVKENLHFC